MLLSFHKKTDSFFVFSLFQTVSVNRLLLKNPRGQVFACGQINKISYPTRESLITPSWLWFMMVHHKLLYKKYP